MIKEICKLKTIHIYVGLFVLLYTCNILLCMALSGPGFWLLMPSEVRIATRSMCMLSNSSV